VADEDIDFKLPARSINDFRKYFIEVSKIYAAICSLDIYQLKEDKSMEIVRSGDHCNMRYRSVIGFGNASLVEAQEDKRNYLDLIMRHYLQEPFAYPEDTLKRTAIIKVEIEEMTGKAYGY
jgi:predicted S18 family serine protease